MSALARRVALGAASILQALFVHAGDGVPQAASPSKGPVTLRGTWVLDAAGKAVGPGDFRRGLQASGLAWRDGVLWCVGDQRGEFPGRVMRIDPRSGRMIERPMELHAPATFPGSSRERTTAFAKYAGVPNPDFEALAVHPTDRHRLFVITEDKTPWIVEIDLRKRDSPAVLAGTEVPEIVALTEIELPAGLAPWNGDTNFRAEGLALSDDGKTVWVAFERAADGLPRILETTLTEATSGDRVLLRDVAIDFAAVPRRADKERALLNLNDILFVRRGGRPALVGVARDQERLLWIDIEQRRVASWLDLDLRDPQGESIHWVSPEGVALDAPAGLLWLINDPDSVRGNYKRRGAEAANGRFAEFAPLLFALELERLADGS